MRSYLLPLSMMTVLAACGTNLNVRSGDSTGDNGGRADDRSGALIEEGDSPSDDDESDDGDDHADDDDGMPDDDCDHADDGDGMSDGDGDGMSDDDDLYEIPSIASPSCSLAPDSDALALCLGQPAVLDGQPYSDIQAALDASAGQAVKICPGTWDVELTVDHTVTLEAADPTQPTVLSGGGVHPIIHVSTGSLTVRGLTLADGVSDYAGGAIESSGPVTLDCALVQGNYAGYEGGAVLVHENTLTVLDSVFLDNYADNEGGALEVDGWSSSTLIVERSVFLNNSAGYNGGAIAVGAWAHDDVLLTDVLFENNSAGYSGGAFDASSWDQVTIDAQNLLVLNNHAPEAGGFNIDPNQAAWATFENAHFIGNTGDGAALMVGSWGTGGEVLVSQSSFQRNVASADSAAIVAAASRSLTVIDTHLGVGVNDNAPNDILAGGQTFNGGAGSNFATP